MFGGRFKHRGGDRRSRMIAEAGAFLTLALSGRVRLPPIPRRRVRAGGYDALLSRPGARAAVNHWWKMAIDAAEAVERASELN